MNKVKITRDFYHHLIPITGNTLKDVEILMNITGCAGHYVLYARPIT